MDTISGVSLDLNKFNNIHNLLNKPVFNISTKFDYLLVNKVNEKYLGKI